MPQTSNRVKISVRIHPETEALARKLANQYFGSEKRIGYVLDEAVNLFHASKVRPAEVESLLSSTEEYLIRNFNNQVRKATERVTDMVAKSVYEINLISLMVDKIGHRALPDWKEQLHHLRKEAHQKTKRKVGSDEYSPEIVGLIEEHEKLEEEVKRLQTEREQLIEKLKRYEEVIAKVKDWQERLETQRKTIEKQNDEINRMKSEKAAILAWTRGLLTYMKENYSRVKTNEKLIEEYISSNPKPSEV